MQLQILTGKRAGQRWEARRFPARIGRSATADLALDDDGVWDWHLEIGLEPNEGVILHSNPEALSIVNGHPVTTTPLQMGDMIDAGSVKLRFGLCSTRQRSLRFREVVTWTVLGGLCLGQVALIYWLLR